MRLFPFQRLTLRVNDPPEVIKAKLTWLAGEGPSPSGLFSSIPPVTEFIGSFDGNQFEVVRVVEFIGLPVSNPCRPVIDGEIVPTAGGTEVRAWMRPNAFGALFMAMWLGAVLCFAVSAAWAGSGVGFLVLMGFGFLAYFGMSVAFWTEATAAHGALREALGAVDAEVPNRLMRR